MCEDQSSVLILVVKKVSISLLVHFSFQMMEVGSNGYYSKLNKTIYCQYIPCLFAFFNVFFVSFRVFPYLFVSFHVFPLRVFSCLFASFGVFSRFFASLRVFSHFSMTARMHLSEISDKGWYAQRRCTFTLERNADFGRRAMLLNEENSGIPAAT